MKKIEFQIRNLVTSYYPRLRIILLTIILISVGQIGCDKSTMHDEFISNNPERENISPSGLLKSSPDCITTLIAGQNYDIGSVALEFNATGDHVTITYSISMSDWCLYETHLDVQVAPENFPQTKKGNPKVGHFAFGESLECETSWVHSVDLSTIDDWDLGDPLYIAAHAEVMHITYSYESAWANGQSFPGKNWAMYFYCEPPIIFNCGSPLIDIRDGQSYNTVQIGTQCWMAENLNIGTRIDASTSQTDNGIIEKYCYDDLGVNCDEYGGLYQWYEMMQYTEVAGVQGICPTGWRLPSDPEWTTLTDFLGGTIVAGGALKEPGTSHWQSPNNTTTSSGFNALPDLGGNQAVFWTSSKTELEWAWIRALDNPSTIVQRTYVYRGNAHSVRCIKD